MPLRLNVERHADILLRQRWRVMQTHEGSLAELQNAVKFNGDSSPCVTGLRSVCWKVRAHTEPCFLCWRDRRLTRPD